MDYKVLIPKSSVGGHKELIADFFKSLYDTETDYVKYENTYYNVINVNPSKGKEVAIKFNSLNNEFTYFIKNGWLLKKWSDTGIVDKLGACKIEDNEIKLVGV